MVLYPNYPNVILNCFTFPPIPLSNSLCPFTETLINALHIIRSFGSGAYYISSITIIGYVLFDGRECRKCHMQVPQVPHVTYASATSATCECHKCHMLHMIVPQVPHDSATSATCECHKCHMIVPQVPQCHIYEIRLSEYLCRILARCIRFTSLNKMICNLNICKHLWKAAFDSGKFNTGNKSYTWIINTRNI